MSEKNSKFVKKISPLIEGQVPDFVQSDHPIFVEFLKDYFSFLEAGRLTVSAEIDFVIQETNTTAYILEETNSDRIVTESGSGSGGKFQNGETITGGTSNATAKILVEDSRNGFLYISGQQLFNTGETILDLIEEQDNLVYQTKKQCSLIEVKSTAKGTQTFDLPQHLKRNTSVNRARRDNYTTLMIGTWAMKCYYDMISAEDVEVDETFTPMML